MGRCGARHAPQLSYLQGSWSKVSNAARELATVFSVTFFSVTIAGQFVNKPPPNGKCLGTQLPLPP